MVGVAAEGGGETLKIGNVNNVNNADIYMNKIQSKGEAQARQAVCRQ